MRRSPLQTYLIGNALFSHSQRAIVLRYRNESISHGGIGRRVC
jgi:hypothetical protein